MSAATTTETGATGKAGDSQPMGFVPTFEVTVRIRRYNPGSGRTLFPYTTLFRSDRKSVV